LWYLPVVIALMMVHKHGMDWARWAGLKSKDEEEQHLDFRSKL
jgi:protoheme IX farnesyltransferase